MTGQPSAHILPMCRQPSTHILPSKRPVKIITFPCKVISTRLTISILWFVLLQFSERVVLAVQYAGQALQSPVLQLLVAASTQNFNYC